MERTRHAALAALIVALSAGGAALATAGDPAGSAAAATWPVSTLLVSEVQTGGSSASDEFAEITNVGPAAVDLAGLELVYVTATGGTVTRKASWSSSLLLEPGRHLFIANGSGIYAGLADATYSGGFAATGGAIVLRPIGGAPIDALGWGDATNAFVEGSPAPAPAAGSSVEREPGGMAGNTTDTNDNAADFFAQPAPNPQSLAAPPVPAPGETAEPSGTPGATPVPSPAVQPSMPPTPGPTPSAEATAGPSVEPTSSPTDAATATPHADPTLAPSLAPTPETSPTPMPTLTPEPTPTVAPPTDAPPTPTAAPTAVPTATPVPAIPIAEARGLAGGSPARIEGVLTTSLGALESGRKAFVQDATGGIAIYLDAAVVASLPPDTLVSVTGTIDQRFAERTIRAAEGDVIVLGEQQRAAPAFSQTGEVGELVEGSRVLVQGVTVGAPSDLADGLGLMVDDGSGAVRVIVGSEALGGASVPSGTSVVAVGPVGQRDSSGTGTAGYRIHATLAGELEILPPPTPSPEPTIAPTPTPTSSATPSPSAVPSLAPSQMPSASPAPSLTPVPSPGPTAPPTQAIADARSATIGAVVTVRGVVVAEAGRLGLPPLIAIADGTSGIVVRLPDGAAPPARGTLVAVQGKLADPYGQLEIRPASTGFATAGQGSLPTPLRLAASELGEATEGRLAEVTGTVAASPRKGSSGDITVDLVDAAGNPLRIVCDGSSGIEPAAFVKGREYRLVGVVGQRASRKGALDGYRIYLRDGGDITRLAGSPGPGASAAPGATEGPGSGGTATPVPIATALAYADGTAAVVEGVVTAPADLLDSTGRRTVIQDDSGAIEVLLPIGSTQPAVGTRVRVTGKTGRAYGAPRLGAAEIESLGRGSVAPLALGRAPAERDEWRLVRISGTVEKVERLGDRWRAEVVLAGGGRAPVHGQAGAGIPSTAIVVGRRITVTGIVRRPYPTATDRRFAVLPRDGGDVAIGPGGAAGAGRGGSGGAGSAGSAGPGGPAAGPAASPAGVDITPDTDLAVLAEHEGERVRVGGLVARVGADGFDLDDGTALAHVRLEGSMAALLPHLHAGEAIAATGRVAIEDGVGLVIVDDDGSLFRVGSLGQALPLPGGPTAGASLAPNDAAISADAVGLASEIAPTSIIALAGLALLSVVATVVRRRLVQRRLRAVLVARLAGLASGEAALVASDPEPPISPDTPPRGPAAGPA